MGVHRRFLAALTTLLCVFHPVNGAKGCSDLRNLENGQTFFRYGGLFVIFNCRHGYKLHGHKTNSCVAGRWSRDPPICVGSGCPSPGPVAHGSFSVNDDSSWVVFSCDSGYRLVGPLMSYCKGNEWNSSKPFCEESDMMRSLVSSVTALKPSVSQTLKAARDLKTKVPSLYQTQAALRDATLLVDTSHSNTDQTKTHPQQPFYSTRSTSLENQEMQILSVKQAEFLREPAFTAPKKDITIASLTKTLWASTAYATTSTNSPTKLVPATTVQPSHLMRPTTFSDKPTPQNVATSSKADYSKAKEDDQTTQNAFRFIEPVPQALVSTKSTFTTLLATQATTPSPAVTSSQNNIYSTNRILKWTEISEVNRTPGLSLLPSRRPSCPFPPVPAHGSFYFSNKEIPGPIEDGRYIRYVCHPGYTLAHGDALRSCGEGGTWSGVTPVCVELSVCSVDNGGCSQLCTHSHHYDQASNQTRVLIQCGCRPGYTLLEDGRTCRDVDECAEGQHQCQHRCINTFGSFQCTCDVGYQPSPDRMSCTDMDECVLPTAVTGCVFGCVNSPGSFHCQCPAGYTLQSADAHCQDIDECAANGGLGPCSEQCHNSPGSYHCSCSYGHTLAGDGLGCIYDCPSGFRKQPIRPQNTTLPPKDECVDINECEEEETCEWQCVNLPGTYRCICPKGYTLTRDGRGCRDINECIRKNGGCSHVCINRKGSYKCACPPSHRLSPYSWKKCIPRQL